MLLTVTTTHRPARDLGYLLYKHPDRVQEFDQSFGTATVLYPAADDERCTAALLLSVDPVRLARSRTSSPDFSLGQYVNDRSYAASSLLAVALGDVFSTARSGRCASRQDVADSAIPLQVHVPVLPCRGGPEVARRVFEPLGWHVDAAPIPLDEAFPHWGDSRYVDLTLTGTVRLADALNQLYVALPVLDDAKHYWQGPDEVDKLLRSGTGWLADHPDAEFIARRYLGRRSGLTRAALARLAEVGDDVDEAVEPEQTEDVAQAPDQQTPLAVQRHDTVVQALLERGVRTVIDLGCGPGDLLTRLAAVPSLTRVAGCDVSVRALRTAARRLHLDRLSERQAARLELFQSALTYEDERLAGFDAAVLMEVIEHVDPERLPALEHAVLGAARPRHVLVTTPNRDHNPLYPWLTGLRHPDHRFEFTREEFASWCRRVGDAHGYDVELGGIGRADDELGAPTQFAVLTRRESVDA